MAKKTTKVTKKAKGKSITQIKLTPGAKLAAVIGVAKVTRPQATKLVWAYIKKHKLQDKKNKRMIIADAKLKPLFAGKKAIGMFELAKYLKKELK